MAVHTCTRCPLKFAHRAELMDHLEHDHHVPPGSLDQHYAGAQQAKPLYRSFVGDDQVHTVLLVANQTVASEAVRAALQDLADRHDNLAVYVAIPATPSQHLVAEAGGGRLPPPSQGLDGRTDEAGMAQARWRLRTALKMLAELGVAADGRVADPNPIVAVGRAIDDHPIDEILLSTLSPTMSRWLQADLPATLERRFSVPVTTLTSDPVSG